MRKILIILFTTVLFCFSLFSQSQQTGMLKGTVRMADGTKLSGVSVALDGTGLSRITDTDGTFSFPEVSQGRYILVASLDGWTILSQGDQLMGPRPRTPHSDLAPMRATTEKPEASP